MAARADDRMVPVELVDDDLDRSSSRLVVPADVPVSTGVHDGAAPRPRGPLVRWAVAGVVLAALALVSVATTGGGDPGVPPGPLAQPLREAWATPADEVLAISDGLVLVQSTGSREPQVRALDETNGREVWAQPLGRDGVADDCATGLTAPPAMVWCWRDPHWHPDGDSGRRITTPQGLVGLDAATGEVLLVHEMGVPSAGWAVVGGDLVLASRRDDVVHVERIAPSGWTTVWTTTVDLPPGLGHLHRTVTEVTEGLIVLKGPTTAVIDPDDGRVLASWTADPAEEGTVLDAADVVVTDAGFAAWSSAVRGERLPDAVWHDRDGTVLTSFSGDLLVPAESDHSVSDVLLVTRDGGATVTALSVGSGADLWEADLEGGSVVARHDGVVVLALAEGISAYEVLTGRHLWSAPVDGLHAGIGGLSDGETVVVTAVRARRWTAVAHRLTDGVLLWSAELPGVGEITLVPYPPEVESFDGTPIVRIGRTLVWTDA